MCERSIMVKYLLEKLKIMGLNSAKSRKKFFADLNKVKPDTVELTLSGSIAPIPSLGAQVKTVWNSDNKRFHDAQQKLLEQKMKRLEK